MSLYKRGNITVILKLSSCTRTIGLLDYLRELTIIQ